MPGKWSEEDDIKLWSLRSKPVPQLSTRFNKTAGAIRSRLIHYKIQHTRHISVVSRMVIEMLEPDSAPAAVGRRGAESE